MDNPPAIHEYDYHQPWKYNRQLISDCGGGNDENGILWSISGKYYIYPGEDIRILSKKYSRWYPSIDSRSMVKKGGGVPIPNIDELAPGAMEEYERLMKISRIKYVVRDGNTWITRELL